MGEYKIFKRWERRSRLMGEDKCEGETKCVVEKKKWEVKINKLK